MRSQGHRPSQLSAVRPGLDRARTGAAVMIQSDGLVGVRDGMTELARADAIDEAISSVFVIDDDASRREALELVVRTAGWEAEGFASAEAFLSQSREPVPCCLILDLMLPRSSGLELQKRLRGRPDIPIIFISGQTDVPMTVQAMKAGAVDVLTKPVNHAALLHAIRAAMVRSRAAIRRDADAQSVRDCYSSLTTRERQVMTLVVSGLLNKQIGGELGISEATVKAH